MLCILRKAQIKGYIQENHNASEPFNIGNGNSENNIGSIGQSAHPQLSVKPLGQKERGNP